MSASTLVFVLPIVLLLLLALAIWWFVSSSNARRAEQARAEESARAEAAALRDQAAAQHEPTLAAQEAYAVQAAEREAWAHREAEDAELAAVDARRAADEAEARAAQAAEEAEAGRLQLQQTEDAYAEDLQHADVLDPDTDVTEDDAWPADEVRDREVQEEHAEPAPAEVVEVHEDEESPLTSSVDSTPMFREVARDHDLSTEEVLQSDATATPAAWGDALTSEEPVTADAPVETEPETEAEPIDEPEPEPETEPEPATELAEAPQSGPSDAGGDWQHDEAMFGEESADTVAAMPSEAPETEAWGRRISDLDEVSDGGFGVGSAAPIEDGAQPLGHPIQAYFDSRTYRTQSSPGYDSCEPDVWFFDEDSAQRAGFGPAQDD